MDVKEMQKRIFNLKVVPVNEGTCLEFHLPGLTYSDFSRTGIAQLWSVSKLLESTRAIPLRYPEHFILPEYLDRPYVNMLVAQRMTFEPEFYQRVKLHFPLVCTIRHGHLGKRSTSVVITLHEATSRRQLLSNQRQFTLVDKATKMAVPLPHDYRASFTPSPDVAAINVAVVPCPEGAFLQRRRVMHSDTDYLHHTNQSAYMRFCLDAAAEAVASHRLRHYTGDMFAYPVSGADVVHQGETFAGDELDIAVWEDSQTAVLFFQIVKKEKPVCFTKITFYGKELMCSKL